VRSAWDRCAGASSHPAAKEPKLAPINARAETLATSPMFRDAFRRHRCLIVADGFYEWRKNDDGRRRHHEQGARPARCVVATCPSNELMEKIHDRMPVILPPGARDRWLDPTASEAELRRLLVPLRAEDLNAYEVSALVNSPRNDSPECVRSVE
jgi:putative SOS response-associated peptidase YedK